MIECYETILCFPNFPLYKKKKKYEKFRGPFEHEVPGDTTWQCLLNLKKKRHYLSDYRCYFRKLFISSVSVFQRLLRIDKIFTRRVQSRLFFARHLLEPYWKQFDSFE